MMPQTIRLSSLWVPVHSWCTVNSVRHDRLRNAEILSSILKPRSNVVRAGRPQEHYVDLAHFSVNNQEDTASSSGFLLEC